MNKVIFVSRRNNKTVQSFYEYRMPSLALNCIHSINFMYVWWVFCSIKCVQIWRHCTLQNFIKRQSSPALLRQNTWLGANLQKLQRRKNGGVGFYIKDTNPFKLHNGLTKKDKSMKVLFNELHGRKKDALFLVAGTKEPILVDSDT